MNFQGTDYAVSDQVFEQFKAGYEQAQKQSADKRQPAVAGDARHRPAPLADRPQERRRGEGRRHRHDQDHRRRRRQQAARRRQHGAREGAQRSASRAPDSLPEKLTDEQKQQAADAIKDLSVEIYTGKDDTIAAPDGRQHGRRRQGQRQRRDHRHARRSTSRCSTSTRTRTIEAPSGRQAVRQLLGQLGGLGLGGAGSSGSGSSGSGSGSGGGVRARTSRSTPTASPTAGSDTAKAQKCADLLSP